MKTHLPLLAVLILSLTAAALAERMRSPFIAGTHLGQVVQTLEPTVQGSPESPLPLPEGGPGAGWEKVQCRTGACLWEKKDGASGVVLKAWYAHGEEDKKEAKVLSESEIKTKAGLEEYFKTAAKNGKDIIILQVGNLDSCPPCKALDKDLRDSVLGKDAKVSILDFNYNRGSVAGSEGRGLVDYLHKDLKLPASFGYPYVYVFHVGKNKTIDTYNDTPGNASGSLERIKEITKQLRSK